MKREAISLAWLSLMLSAVAVSMVASSNNNVEIRILLMIFKFDG
jgi:hypothetical protein